MTAEVLQRLSENARVTVRRGGPPDPQGTCVVYWMQRAQRGRDNPALDVAVQAANALGKPVVVFFAPIPFYPHANLRHYAFLAEGIVDIAADCERRGIGFVLRRWPEHRLDRLCEEVRPALVVGDENPLREPERWRAKAQKLLRVPMWTVDADVVVPARLIDKPQYAARTIRPRLASRLPEFLVKSANPKARVPWRMPREAHALSPEISVDQLTAGWPLDRSVPPVAEVPVAAADDGAPSLFERAVVTGWERLRGGTREGERLLREFVRHKLARYGEDRGHPELDGTSRLSPYLHFGHLSPVAVAWAVQQADAPQEEKDAFFNELLTWRELAVNFVRTCPEYDSFECGEDWAHRTLAEHARDPRPALYTERQLDDAKTGDPLWNAAQRQMRTAGWMHNTMRMYWAKKILEWSRSPAQAYGTAVHLNDRYFLDGRDPNGYAGVAWAIVGKFDRPWPERPVFGKIRYMSQASTGKKFNSKRYIEQWR